MHELTESYIGNCCRTRANVFADEKDRGRESASLPMTTRDTTTNRGVDIELQYRRTVENYCFKQVRVEPRTSALNVTLPAAAARAPAAVDICRLRAQAAASGRCRSTGQTDTRLLHR